MLDKQTSLGEFQGEFLKNLYREFPDLVRRLGELRPRIHEEIMLPFLDEGRRLGYVSERASNEAVVAYLQLIQSNADRSSTILSRFDSNPELFDQVYDLILHGLILNGPPVDRADSNADDVSWSEKQRRLHVFGDHSEFVQDTDKPLRVRVIKRDPDIHVSGCPWISLVADCVSADQQVLNLMIGEQLQELSEVLRKLLIRHMQPSG